VARLRSRSAIADVDATRQFLEAALATIAGTSRRRRRLSAVIAVPADARPLERRGIVEAATRAGIRRTQLIAEPVAAAMGCGIDPLQARSHLVVDVGAGTSQVAAVGGKGMLTHRCCPVAGDDMTSALSRYLRRQHRLIVGELTAERTKIGAFTGGSELPVEGLDAGTGRARAARVVADEVVAAVQPVADEIASGLGRCLQDLPVETISDVMSDGILAVGGAMSVPALRLRLEETLGFPIPRADQPLTRVAEGAARCLANPDWVAVHGLR
jgi:rod shape-determining protein MreB